MLSFLTTQWITARDAMGRSYGLFLKLLASQVTCQAINMVTAFLIIRALSKDEYSIFTIINTTAPVLLMLSNTGIASGLSSIGRHFWEDDDRMGRLVTTGLEMRRKFGVVTFIFIGPMLMWLLYRNHAAVSTICLLVVITLVGTSLQLTSGVMRMVLSLRQQIGVLAKVGITSAVVRLVLVAFFIHAFHLNAVLAALAATCALAMETFFDIRYVKPQINWNAPSDPEYKQKVIGLVHKTIPLTVYFCVQGQAGVWLLSIFGNGHQVADIGAAGRIGMIFATFATAYAGLVSPRFARNNGRQRLFSLLFQIIAGMLFALVVAVACVWLFPQPLLWLLGARYNNMAGLLWLVVLASGITSLAGLVFGLNMTKGWVPPAIITIPVEVITQIVLLLVLDLGNIRSVLIFVCISALTPTILNLIILLRNINRETS